MIRTRLSNTVQPAHALITTCTTPDLHTQGLQIVRISGTKTNFELNDGDWGIFGMAAKLQHAETAMEKFDQAGFEAGRLAVPVRLIADEFAQRQPIRTESDQKQPSVAETIDYIQTFAQELRQMAQQAGLSRLALILTLAEQEAGQELKRDR